ncbi:sensor histidine kinase [Paraflavitalea soli]|nr:sensor histidine kinase [Paraflavitalea soli]
MKRWNDLLGMLKKHYETWLYIGLLCWVVIFQLLEQKSMGWGFYLKHLSLVLFLLLPVLVFSWYKEQWLQTWSRRRYLWWWVICFAVYLPLVIYGLGTLVLPNSHLQLLIVVSAGCSLLLELVLVANAWYQQRLHQWKWIQKLSLEKSILISVSLISVILAIMGVSSIGNPAYDEPGRLLLGFEFSLWKVITRFGTFLGFTVQFLFMYLCGYFFFYLNNRILVPKILKPKGLILYCMSALAAVGIIYPVIAQLLAWLPFNHRLGMIFSANPFVLENAFGAIIIILLSLPVVLALQWSKQNGRIMALEKEKAETELDLLKQQLNPHFFFNTLNNLYALSLAQSKQTPESILQLSELMRYVIYKTKEPAVSIQEEIRYLEDYIQLQRIRLKRKPDIQFSQEVAADTPSVPPLLLIVLVENAFKHGVEPAEERAFLHISLRADARRLYFSCINSFEQETANKGGIGLANLQRRLALLYPGKHQLKTGIENHTFKAELELDLS